MNAKLAKAKDGTGGSKEMAARFETMCECGPSYETGQLYWPFAIAWDGLNAPLLYTVTHLPSGRLVIDHLTRRDALSLIRKLRALKCDLRFTQAKGSKWNRAKILMKPIVYKFKDKP